LPDSRETAGQDHVEYGIQRKHNLLSGNTRGGNEFGDWAWGAGERIKFRKKPVVVEAFQWFPHMGEVGGVVYWPPGEIGRKPVIRTIEACQDVTAGDWIITGVQGERYPCKPDIFAATYEPVEEAVSA